MLVAANSISNRDWRGKINGGRSKSSTIRIKEDELRNRDAARNETVPGDGVAAAVGEYVNILRMKIHHDAIAVGGYSASSRKIPIPNAHDATRTDAVAVQKHFGTRNGNSSIIVADFAVGCDRRNVVRSQRVDLKCRLRGRALSKSKSASSHDKEERTARI